MHCADRVTGRALPINDMLLPGTQLKDADA